MCGVLTVTVNSGHLAHQLRYQLRHPPCGSEPLGLSFSAISGSSFLIMHTLRGSGDWLKLSIPATHMGDLQGVPSSQPQLLQVSEFLSISVNSFSQQIKKKKLK